MHDDDKHVLNITVIDYDRHLVELQFHKPFSYGEINMKKYEILTLEM